MSTYKFTDVKQVIETKIFRNNLAKEILENHINVYENEIKINNLCIASCRVKLNMVNDVNVIEAMQKDEYAKDRESSSNSIISDFDKMDEYLTKSIEDIREQTKKIMSKLKKLTKTVMYINNKIPSTGVATNYRVKLN